MACASLELRFCPLPLPEESVRRCLLLTYESPSSPSAPSSTSRAESSAEEGRAILAKAGTHSALLLLLLLARREENEGERSVAALLAPESEYELELRLLPDSEDDLYWLGALLMLLGRDRLFEVDGDSGCAADERRRDAAGLFRLAVLDVRESGTLFSLSSFLPIRAAYGAPSAPENAMSIVCPLEEEEAAVARAAEARRGFCFCALTRDSRTL